MAAMIASACERGNPVGPQEGGGVALRLVAPTTIAPGESVQLTANAIRSDGSAEDVSAKTEWTVASATAGSVLSVTATGLVSAGERGEGVIAARFRGLSDRAAIFVLPKDTFRLTGKVSGNSVGLQNVTITVVGGVGEGLTVVTTVDGDYALYGVAGLVEVRAAKDGFLDTLRRVDATGHRTYSFEIPTSRPTRDYRGAYTLTINTESTGAYCSPHLPAELRRRVYTASVEQTGADLKVSLTGADFVINRQGLGNSFVGAVGAAGEISFWLSPASIWDYGVPDVVERLSDGTAICVAGTIVAESTPIGISGTISKAHGGTIYPCSGSYTSHAGCEIDRFEMVRQ